MSKNICPTCGASCEEEKCFRHKKKKSLPKIAKKLISLKKETDDSVITMWNFFKEIWNKRPHKSEISGEWLGNEPLTIFFHHVLKKEKYPEAALDEENIILLTWEEHDSVEMDMYKYPEINNRRIVLLRKYRPN